MNLKRLLDLLITHLFITLAIVACSLLLVACCLLFVVCMFLLQLLRMKLICVVPKTRPRLT